MHAVSHTDTKCSRQHTILGCWDKLGCLQTQRAWWVVGQGERGWGGLHAHPVVLTRQLRLQHRFLLLQSHHRCGQLQGILACGPELSLHLLDSPARLSCNALL